jgi:nickel transport protein
MTSFRQSCCFYLLLLGLLLVPPAFAAETQVSAPELLLQLQQENATLQGNVRRLEHQVTALRDELNSPDATQIIGGIGYIVGLFGIAGWLAARKINRQEN